jgi:hypothetical protein
MAAGERSCTRRSTVVFLVRGLAETMLDAARAPA